MAVHEQPFINTLKDKDVLLAFGFKRYSKMIAEIPVSDRLSKTISSNGTISTP